MRFIKNPNEDFVRMIVEKNRVHSYPKELGSNIEQVKINVEFSEIERARHFLDAIEAQHYNKQLPELEPFDEIKKSKEDEEYGMFSEFAEEGLQEEINNEEIISV